jgi:hypothetical protein
MAAGLGFKDFVTGEVLTAADVDGYLMQGVWVFASAAARDAAVTAPQEGNFAYLKDTNVTTYYTGSAWANLDTTGMTNPMTTTGDTIYSSSGSTPARLGIGTTGQVLTVAAGVPSWATPAAGGGGKVLQVVYASYSTTGQTTSTTYADTGLTANITPASATSKILVLVTAPYTKQKTEAGNGKMQIVRGSTALISIQGLGYTETASNNDAVYSQNYLDSPASTATQTYKLQYASGSSGVTFDINPRVNSFATITLMEIGA